MKQLLGQYTRFFSRLKHYAVIEVMADVVRVSLLVQSKAGTEFELQESQTRTLTEPTLEAQCAALTQILKSFRLPADVQIIVSLDHTTVTTVQAEISIVRRDPKTPLTEIELENLVSQGLWKMFNAERAASARKMRIGDVDVQVVGADLIGIKLDNHRALNPVGFSARSVEFCMRQTLANQHAIKKLLSVVPEEQVVSIQEASALWPILAHTASSIDMLALCVLAHETVLYRYRGEDLHYIDTFAWGSTDISAAVAALCGVTSEQAEGIIELYRSGRASPAVLKKIESVLTGELATVLKAIEAQRLVSGEEKIFVYSFFEIPRLIMGPRLQRRLHLRVPFTILDKEFIGEKFGYRLILSQSVQDSEQLTPILASLTVFLLSEREDPLSKIAKQRARWLQRV